MGSVFKTAGIPVSKQTAREIGDLRADEENASTSDIAWYMPFDIYRYPLVGGFFSPKTSS